MKKVYLYNSLSGKKEEFIPKDPNLVTIYSCGPTVYNYPHIGNIRSFLFVDTLRRTLKLAGFQLRQAMNITDVDDKIINQSIQNNTTIEEFTKQWIEIFFKELETMRIQKLEFYPKATDSVPEMIEILERLSQNKLLYEKEGSFYFPVRSFIPYGKLSKIDVTGLQTGTRYDTDEYDKGDVRDFVLWKSPKHEKEKFWQTTNFGNGRPGWHLECSAMIRKIFGSGVDIHTGGIDLMFPHHENEIAQSEGAYPEESFVSLWMHCEHLLVDGEKMSKSKGNFFTLKDILDKESDPKVLRFLFLSSHYRSKLNFSLSKLKEGKQALEKIQNTIYRLMSYLKLETTNADVFNQLPLTNTRGETEEFLSALFDDLNSPKALGIVFDTCKAINTKLESSELDKDQATVYLDFFRVVNSLFDSFSFVQEKEETSENIVEKLEELILKRKEAKQRKDFASADSFRSQALELGYTLIDTKEGETKWKRNNQT